MSIVIEAEITWLSAEDGGMGKDPASGIKPSFAIANDLIMSTVRRKDGGEIMNRGQLFLVTIQLSYGERYKDKLTVGMPVRLQQGARVLATGKVTSLNCDL